MYEDLLDDDEMDDLPPEAPPRRPVSVQNEATKAAKKAPKPPPIIFPSAKLKDVQGHITNAVGNTV